MSRARNILEKYFTSFRSALGMVDIFINPSKGELRELGTEVRFIADIKSKKVYAFDASKANHGHVWRRIGDSRDYREPTLLMGSATNGVMTDSHVLRYGHLRPSIHDQPFPTWSWKDWTWVDKYIKVTDYLKKYRQEKERQ